MSNIERGDLFLLSISALLLVFKNCHTEAKDNARREREKWVNSSTLKQNRGKK